jgi:hypothetical protein
MSDVLARLKKAFGYAPDWEHCTISRKTVGDAIAEIERLQAIIDAVRPECGYGRVFDDYVVTVPIVTEFWRHGTLEDRVQALRDDRDRLQGIVERLPKDAEGNPLFVGMRRWVSDEDSRGPFQGWETITQLRQRPNGEWEVFCKTCDTTPECCWSSMEAAEKARQSNG